MNLGSSIPGQWKLPAIGYLACVVITLLVALMLVPGDWYIAAIKPIWAPPAGLLSILWAASCMLLALTARQTQQVPRRSGRWVILNLVFAIGLYWAWWWLFFGLHRIGWSIAVQTLAVLATATLLGQGHLLKRIGSWLLLLWASYLWLLNYSVWALNGGGIGS